jgi:hypothetical protein
METASTVESTPTDVARGGTIFGSMFALPATADCVAVALPVDDADADAVAVGEADADAVAVGDADEDAVADGDAVEDADVLAVGDANEDAVALAVAVRDGLGQSCHDTMTAPETPSHPSLSQTLPLPPLP